MCACLCRLLSRQNGRPREGKNYTPGSPRFAPLWRRAATFQRRCHLEARARVQLCPRCFACVSESASPAVPSRRPVPFRRAGGFASASARIGETNPNLGALIGSTRQTLETLALATGIAEVLDQVGGTARRQGKHKRHPRANTPALRSHCVRSVRLPQADNAVKAGREKLKEAGQSLSCVGVRRRLPWHSASFPPCSVFGPYRALLCRYSTGGPRHGLQVVAGRDRG